jgi:hypothetical protein
MTTTKPAPIPQNNPMTDSPAPIPVKRSYRRRSITAGPGTKLVMEQEQKLAEARKIARALNDVATMSEWGLNQIKTAIEVRNHELTQP